jgi:hypothetical protein
MEMNDAIEIAEKIEVKARQPHIVRLRAVALSVPNILVDTNIRE